MVDAKHRRAIEHEGRRERRSISKNGTVSNFGPCDCFAVLIRLRSPDAVERVTPRDYDASGVTQPEGLKTRSVEAGFLASIASGRLGLGNNSPPQLGHNPASFVSVQSEQKVHSKEQILASVESGGRSRLQHSHPGLSWSMADSCFLDGSVLSQYGIAKRL